METEEEDGDDMGFSNVDGVFRHKNHNFRPGGRDWWEDPTFKPPLPSALGLFVGALRPFDVMYLNSEGDRAWGTMCGTSPLEAVENVLVPAGHFG